MIIKEGFSQGRELQKGNHTVQIFYMIHRVGYYQHRKTVMVNTLSKKE